MEGLISSKIDVEKIQMLPTQDFVITFKYFNSYYAEKVVCGPHYAGTMNRSHGRIQKKTFEES